MDPEKELKRLLDTHTVEVRTKGRHPVHILDNGERVTISRTNDAPPWIELKKVRHKLGISNMGRTLEEQLRDATAEVNPIDAIPEPQSGSVPTLSPMRKLVDSKVQALETAKRELTKQLEGVNRELDKMAKAMVLMDDPDMEELLYSLTQAAPKAEPTDKKYAQFDRIPCEICGKPMSRARMGIHLRSSHTPGKLSPPSASQLHKADEITSQLVWAASQTYERDFTARDLYMLMMAAPMIAEEQSRCMQAISKALAELQVAGKVNKVGGGTPGHPVWWRKVDVGAVIIKERAVQRG